MPLHRRHRKPPTLRSRLVRALVSTMAITGVCAATAVVGSVAYEVRDDRTGGLTLTERAPTHLQRVMERYDCSFAGYDDGATPRSAIVQRPSGRLVTVSFDEGWRVYTSDGPATLVAVCLRPAP
ncbi:MAG: hypothetical protein ACRDOM_09265 [Nocardioides sp.]